MPFVLVRFTCWLNAVEAFQDHYGDVSKAKDGYEILKDGFSGEAYEDVRKGLELAEAIAASVRFHPAENRQSNWEIISIQGRDYVTASNLERFSSFAAKRK